MYYYIQLWQEKKKLKAALEKAAKIIAKNICPADYEGYNCPLLADIECTQDIAEQCLYKFLLREDGPGRDNKKKRPTSNKPQMKNIS